jgi:mono/diheme cytochrome c family protein
VSRAQERRREGFKRYKEDVKKTGKPFHPYAMLHDTIMSLVVVIVIIGLAAIWYFTSGKEAGDSGILGPRYTEEADPGTDVFVPRPDWYFYFLFYLLRIFKWPESVVLGTVGIPTIALILLLAVPFIDRRRERRLSRRPVAVIASLLVIASMGVLTWKGATVKEGGASGDVQAVVAKWQQANNLPDDALAGAALFFQSGCLNCHFYVDQGGNIGPNLTAEGSKGRGVDFQIKHLKDPRSVSPGSIMPSFAALGDENLNALATFLEASKGGGG